MLDSKVYDSLRRLSLAMAHKSSLNMAGNRKSVQKGISVEFSDFREYMPGDDLRRLDWNVYARLDKMYIREYMEEKEAVVSVLLDTSASMDYGQQKKSGLALELASVISFLSLNNMDRLVIYDMKEMNRGLMPGSGKNAFPKVLEWLESRTFDGEVDMLKAAKQMPGRGPGITVIISDFFHPALFENENPQYEKLIQYLAYRKQRPVILQTLAEEELHISMNGTYNLIDMETNHKIRITLDAASVKKYEKELNRLLSRIKKGCTPFGTYVLCDTAKDRNKLIFEDLRELYDI